jgi:arabinan endo-1,5-alpha-L-arabinosidase
MRAKVKIRLFVGGLLGTLGAIALASVWTLSGDLNSHDPAIYKEGSTWWIFRTWGAGIGVAFSGDGHAWNTGTPIYSGGLSWWGQYNGNTAWTWAPSVVDYKGKALCYYAVSTFGSQKSAIGLTTATSIATGNWADQGAIITSASGNNYNAIDPCFATDSSGNPWLSFGSFWTGIYLTKLSTSTFKPTGSWYHIANNSAGIENSQIVYNGGYYYLFASVGSCCSGASSTYHIVYGRSTSITGPYLDKNGTNMLNGGGTTLDAGSSRYIAPGGESIFNNNGSWVLARHELDSQNNYSTVLFINDLFWVNGWPSY